MQTQDCMIGCIIDCTMHDPISDSRLQIMSSKAIKNVACYHYHESDDQTITINYKNHHLLLIKCLISFFIFIFIFPWKAESNIKTNETLNVLSITCHVGRLHELNL